MIQQSLLCTYPRETKTYVYTDNYMQIFTTTLLTIIKNLKQCKCVSANEWINYSPPAQWNLLSNKKQQTITGKHMNGSQKHHTKCKKPGTKCYIISDSIYRHAAFHCASQILHFLNYKRSVATLH